MLDILFWAHHRALAGRNLELSPLEIAILRRANLVEPIRFHEVANLTRATKTEMTRAAKQLEKLGLIEVTKSTRDARRRVIKLTLKGHNELKQVDRAFETDLLVLMKAAPVFYARRNVKMTSHLMRANVYFPSAGVADKHHYQAGVEEQMTSVVASMSKEEFDMWMAPNFDYDPVWKASRRKAAKQKDDDKIPW